MVLGSVGVVLHMYLLRHLLSIHERPHGMPAHVIVLLFAVSSSYISYIRLVMFVFGGLFQSCRTHPACLRFFLTSISFIVSGSWLRQPSRYIYEYEAEAACVGWCGLLLLSVMSIDIIRTYVSIHTSCV